MHGIGGDTALDTNSTGHSAHKFSELLKKWTLDVWKNNCMENMYSVPDPPSHIFIFGPPKYFFPGPPPPRIFFHDPPPRRIFFLRDPACVSALHRIRGIT